MRAATYTIRASTGFLDEEPSHYDAVCDGSMPDNQVIQNAINAIGTRGGTILLSEGVFNIASTITMGSGILLQGMGALERFNDVGVQRGTTLKLADGFSSTDGMIKLPLQSDSIGFEHLFFWGQRQPYPIINNVNNGSAASFASVQVYIDKCQFSGCIPAIKAVNAWEWWITQCTFGQCGDGTQPVPEKSCAIYVKNQDAASTEGWSNGWHIVRCHVDTTFGRFLYSDYLQTNPATTPNDGFEISFCEVEGNNEFIYGTFYASKIVSNDVLIDDLGSTGQPLQPCLRLIGNNQGGYSLISGNHFAGNVAIISTDYFDHITDNILIPGQNPSAALVQLEAGAYKNSVIGNKIIQGGGRFINDAGSDNAVYMNIGE